MGWTLPANPDPPDTVCIMARVPNDPAYVDAFWGAILDLGAGFKWADDSAHTAILASRRMRQMYYEMVENNCIPAPNIINSPCPSCCEGCMAVRWNGCTLEEYDCSTQTWIPVPSINQPCVSNPAPGGGQTPPGPGLCQKYGLQFTADALTPLPFLVNTGDTIEVLAEVGAGTDGTVNWYCPDGSFFVAGACVGGGAPLTGDPLVGANHMSVVIKIGSAYYPLVSGIFTVPGSVVNQQVYIGVNDATLSDNHGTYGINLNYCNNQAVTPGAWCHELDFTVSPQLFTPIQLSDGGSGFTPFATWLSGVGWQAPYKLQNTIPQYQWGFMIVRDLGVASDLPWTLELKGHGPGVTGVGGALTAGVIDAPDIAHLFGTFINTPSIPTNTPYDDTVSLAGTNRRYLYFYAQDYALGSIPSPLFTLASAKISGNGPNPFGSSNC